MPVAPEHRGRHATRQQVLGPTGRGIPLLAISHEPQIYVLYLLHDGALDFCRSRLLVARP